MGKLKVETLLSESRFMVSSQVEVSGSSQGLILTSLVDNLE